jgi:hypothetical protein
VDPVLAHVEADQAGQAAQERLVHLVEPEGQLLRAGPLLDRRRGAVGEEPAPVDHQDPVGGLVSLLQVVGREQQGLAGRDLFLHGRPEQPPGLHVHPGSRLVEHDQVALADDGQGEPHALRLAPGQAVHPLVGEGLDAGPPERGADRYRSRVQAGDQRHELPDRHLGHQPAGLEHGADLAVLDGMVGVAAEHRDRSRGGLAQREQHVERGRLAGAVRAKQGDGLPRAQVQAQPVDRLQAAVVLAHVIERDDRPRTGVAHQCIPLVAAAAASATDIPPSAGLAR